MLRDPVAGEPAHLLERAAATSAAAAPVLAPKKHASSPRACGCSSSHAVASTSLPARIVDQR
jgi:hypothetical protein